MSGSDNRSTVSVYVDNSACHFPDSRPLRRSVFLTDKEREAIEWFSSYGASNHGLWGKHAASLRGLLERTERRS